MYTQILGQMRTAHSSYIDADINNECLQGRHFTNFSFQLNIQYMADNCIGLIELN